MKAEALEKAGPELGRLSGSREDLSIRLSYVSGLIWIGQMLHKKTMNRRMDRINI